MILETIARHLARTAWNAMGEEYDPDGDMTEEAFVEAEWPAYEDSARELMEKLGL